MLDYIESSKPVEDIGRVSFCDIFEIVKQSCGIMKILKIRNKPLMRDIFKKEFEVLDIIQHNQEYLAAAEQILEGRYMFYVIMDKFETTLFRLIVLHKFNDI